MRHGVSVVLLAAIIAMASCSRADLFKQYEYEEEIDLSLNGAATVYVNASIPALDALRGTSFDPAPNARFDRQGIRDYFTTPVTRVTRISTSRRNNRRFVHVQMDVDDVRRLAEAAPFAWSSYRFAAEDGRVIYRQDLAPAAGGAPGAVNWSGRELIAFRLHLPSTLIDHNAGEGNHKRGNILVWEQLLADRLKGQPLDMTAEMESQSILSHTLWLFGATILAVAAVFGLVVWTIARRGDTPKFARN